MADDFRILRRVQFAETDVAGVLHFSNYFRLMEEVEHAFWRSVGLSVITDRADGRISWPRVAVNCEYQSPARFEDELELSFVVKRVGERSFTYTVEFLRGGECIAIGQSTAVCCAMSDGRFEAIAIPGDIRAKLIPED